MNWDLMFSSFPKILGGLGETLRLVGMALFLGFFLALGLALLRVYAGRVATLLVKGYVFVFRGTPLLVQIFLIYFGLGQVDWIRESWLWVFLREPYWCAVLALTLNTGAYASEIFRGALIGVPHGQIEAALAFGMNPLQRFMRVLLPQATRIALPAYGNEMILMVKASSLASTITLMEMTGVARSIIAKTYAPIELFIVAGSLYLVLNFLVTRLIAWWERSLTPEGR